jgi:hypothetical protein
VANPNWSLISLASAGFAEDDHLTDIGPLGVDGAGLPNQVNAVIWVVG